MKILAHTSFIGDTGYNNHARSFFTALNKYHTVKVRNYTVGSTWNGYSEYCHDNESYITEEMKDMLILQTLYNTDGSRSDYPIYGYKNDFEPELNIVLNDLNHHYFYDNYEGYTIGYNVWETTKYPDDFFNRIKKFDEFWVPSNWQKINLISQGFNPNKIKVVPEGVDEKTFHPIEHSYDDPFTFLLFGRWEYRKSTKEIIETFTKTFNTDEPVKLLISVENPFATDGMSSTEERLDFFNLNNKNIEIVKFPKRNEYIDYLQKGHVFLSCARSEGWNLPLIEAMACGTPSIYSNWGAQLEFAGGLGIPVNTLFEVPASTQHPTFVGNYIEPDYVDLSRKMRYVYENYNTYKLKAIQESTSIIGQFNWDSIAKNISFKMELPHSKKKNFAFVTTGNLNYMPVVDKLVNSINKFSEAQIIVYGVNCEVPIDSSSIIKRRIDPPEHSEYDKWYWKQHACIESLKEDFDYFVWIDGDVVVNYNIDEIEKYFSLIENYPISDIHRQEEFYGYYNHEGSTLNQSFNQNLSELWGVNKSQPYMHVCMFIYNKNCNWWFEEIINTYKSIDLGSYTKYFLWNDEGIDNAMRWKYGFHKHLPLSNFDTSSYDGDFGQTNNQLRDFYTFWNVEGPYNFGRLYGYQYIPKNKNEILYFHGNKNTFVSDKMINYIEIMKNNSLHETEQFYVDEYHLENLGMIKGVEGSTMEIAEKYGWPFAIYHEIYNLEDYYLNRHKKINNGDVVVDLGGNIGIFNRWAYSQGASRVLSFEPDKRYFKLLQKNADPKSELFNAAMSNKIGTTNLYESNHLGGSNIFVSNSTNVKNYSIRTYTLNYLFETGLVDRIDFLKVDIEGAEILVFEGVSDENLMKIKNISIEYHHAHLNFDEELREKFISRLNALGFNSHLLFLGNNNQLQILYLWRQIF